LNSFIGMVQANHNVGTLLLISCISLLYIGCEPSFDPIHENDRHYSVFGYLNASADTQFVRIEKLRDSLATGTLTKLDATVTLTNTSTGQTVTMQDSLFEYPQGRAHNYYTTMEIVPNGSYKLVVKGPAGTSSVDVEIPDVFPEPQLLDPPDEDPFVVVRGIERLVGAKIIYNSCVNCICGSPATDPPPCPAKPYIREMDFYSLADTTSFDNGIIRVPIDSLEDRQEIEMEYPPNREFTITNYRMMIAAGTDQWPDFIALDQEAAGLPDVATNVEGGTGFLGGIISDTLTIGTQSDFPCRKCPEQD